jgi:hypothetical protein
VERNVVAKVIVRAAEPWSTLLTGEVLRELPGLARHETIKVFKAHPAPEASRIWTALGSNAVTSVPRFEDSRYLPFAVVVDDVMRRPADAFDGEPRGVFGRLKGTKYENEPRSVITAWIAQCKARGLLSADLQLTEKARRLRDTLGNSI